MPGFGASLWKILHERGLIFPFGYPGPPVVVLYPLIPWIGVMWAGYALGSVYQKPEPERRRTLFQSGTALVVLFVVVRALNVYGDPAPWARQTTMIMTVLSFLAVSKYPPSLSYLLMTLGPALLFLAAFDGRVRGAVARIFINYGRVPFFFYFLQWVTTHSLALAAVKLTGQPTAFLYSNVVVGPPPPAGWGFNLAVVYVVWMVGLVLTVPAVRVVRWREGAPARLVAQLPVIRSFRLRGGRSPYRFCSAVAISFSAARSEGETTPIPKIPPDACAMRSQYSIRSCAVTSTR